MIAIRVANISNSLKKNLISNWNRKHEGHMSEAHVIVFQDRATSQISSFYLKEDNDSGWKQGVPLHSTLLRRKL
jgi:hypothetical protein